MNHSVATHEKSLLNQTHSPMLANVASVTYPGAASGAASSNQLMGYGANASPPGKDNSYGYINA